MAEANPKTIEILEAMANLEGMVSELYSECAKRFAANAEFWNALSWTEIEHSGYVQDMISWYKRYPTDFQIARPFSISSIGTSANWIRENLQILRAGTASEHKMLSIARDIEISMLEARYFEFLKTNRSEYNVLAGRLASETFEHRKIIEENLKKSI